MLLGSVNQVSITVSNLREAMKFYGPLLEFMGFQVSEIAHNESAQTSLTINANPNEIYVNVGEAKPGLADHLFEVYEPERGLL